MDINVKNSIYLIKNKFKNKIINRNLINTSILLYEKADNKVSAANTTNTASTNEHTLTKFKIKANF